MGSYRVDIGGVTVYADDLDQLDALIARYSNRVRIAAPTPAAFSAHTPATAVKEADGNAPKQEERRRGRARYVPQQVKIPSATKKEAMLKLYNSLDVATHKGAFRALAAKGEEGLHISDLKKILGVPENYKISGFTGALTRRAPAYGLESDDVIIVEFLGAVGGKRIYRYRLTSEMMEVLREQGLVNPGIPFALEGEGGE